MQYTNLLLSLLLGLLSLVAQVASGDEAKNTITTECRGALGTFDVSLSRVAGKSDLFHLRVSPRELHENGDVGSVLMFNQSREFQVIENQVILQSGKAISSVLTTQQLEAFNILQVVPWSADRKTLVESNDKDSMCQLPSVRELAPTQAVKETKKSFEERLQEATAYGYDQCQTEQGKLKIWVLPVTKPEDKPPVYELFVQPVQLKGMKKGLDIALSNRELNYKQLASNTRLNKNRIRSLGYVTEEDYKNYRALAITSHQEGKSFLESVGQSMLCTTPRVRDRSERESRRNSKAPQTSAIATHQN